MSLDYELKRFISRKNAIATKVKNLESNIIAEFRKVEESLEKLDEAEDRILIAVGALRNQAERAANSKLRQAEKRIKDLEKLLEKGGSSGIVKEDCSAIAQAKTLAIFDTILFNISNWSTAGDTAPDFELASQSILFPVVYEQVMKGDEDYFIEEVPPVSLEVIRRGREWVKALRESSPQSLMDPSVWKLHQPAVVSWWLNDALPMIYNVYGETWENIEPFSQQEMVAWRDFPADRALSFPLIFDGMETMKKYRDEIRETTRLSQLDTHAVQTRLDPL